MELAIGFVILAFIASWWWGYTVGYEKGKNEGNNSRS